MSEKGIEIHTGLTPGRIVWGHPLKSRDKIQQDGPNKGNPVIAADGSKVQEWSFGLAWEEAYFDANIWPHMYAEMLTAYPNGAPGRFAWKIKSGTDIDKNGKPYSDREGYKGCRVLTVKTELKCPELYRRNGSGYTQLGASDVKTGDWIGGALNFKCEPAKGQNTPSIYVNPVTLEFVGVGQEIVGQGGADPNVTLAGRQYQLPAGAMAPGSAPAMQPPAVGMPGTSAPPPGMPSAPAGVPPMPGGVPQMPAAPAGVPPMPAAPAGVPPMPAAPTSAPQMPGVPGSFVQTATGIPVMPGAPSAPPPPPPPPAPVAPAMTRPTEPSYIAPNPAGGELWWDGAQWVPGR